MENQSDPVDEGNNVLEYFSSHPATGEIIQRFPAAASRSATASDPIWAGELQAMVDRRCGTLSGDITRPDSRV